MKHTFKAHARYTGGYESSGTLQTKNLDTNISIPASMGGTEIGTNPDEMLLGAATTCFIISLSVLIQRNKLKLEDLKVDSTAHIDVSNGIFTYESISYDVHIFTSETNEKHALIERLVYKAEENCMITRALKGNVKVAVNAINISKP